MTQDPKTVFEFDPLPGESVPVAGTMTPGEPKKRGRKPKEPKAAKPERKKRGPRRVQDAVQERAALVEQQAAATANITANLAVKKTRKPRTKKVDGAEFEIVRQLLRLTEKQRKRVLGILTKVFE